MDLRNLALRNHVDPDGSGFRLARAQLKCLPPAVKMNLVVGERHSSKCHAVTVVNLGEDVEMVLHPCARFIGSA